MQILDMCAAPGSKTAQLIEMLHADMDVPFPGRKTGRNPCFVFKLQKKNQDSLALIVYISSNLISTFQRALSLQMTWTISGATCSCTKPSGSTAPVSWW